MLTLTGREIATISVYSHPPDATVYVGNDEVEKTPLVNYPVTPGKLQILVRQGATMTMKRFSP